MSQAPRSLSPHERSALEATAMGIRCCCAFLESIEEKLLDADDKIVAQNLRDLIGISEEKLIEAFPESVEWFRLWERGRGV